MAITREQVADLQPGDVVEYSDDRYPDVITRGPLRVEDGGLVLGNVRCVRWDDGSVPSSAAFATLTVVSRAPRPLYVNHPRTEPVAGDVVRDADRDDSVAFYVRHFSDWFTALGYKKHGDIPARLRLLVDGETGQVVQ